MGNKIGQPEDRADTSRDPSQADNSLVGIRPSKFLRASVNENFCNKQFWQHMKVQLPPMYVVRREGNFSQASVCLSTGGRIPQSQVLSLVSGPRSFLRVPQCQTGEGVPLSQLGVPQSQPGTHGVPPGWDWSTPSTPETEGRVLAMRRAVCLLRSGKEDFLVFKSFLQIKTN